MLVKFLFKFKFKWLGLGLRGVFGKVRRRRRIMGRRRIIG